MVERIIFALFVLQKLKFKELKKKCSYINYNDI